MAYATASDVASRFRVLDADETTIVNTRLADAERILKARIPDLDAQIVAGTIDQDNVKMVEADMVLRLIRNPDGYTTETDGNYSYTISAQVASGVLEVLGREWALLGIRGGVYSIKPYMRMPWEAR
ncbi:Gp19/Gp15/Gp42 family protein [Amycolatopsis anabasis]|uniref:Gp19/Gp15/Gp42 family protein n=1 Tax=Amycolatopsis anabasis TaxID=1840409 RepID=UPI00131AC724|nr:Gp19/Gp15/Gp42 family protein [Amycolatopsis anabasis]